MRKAAVIAFRLVVVLPSWDIRSGELTMAYCSKCGGEVQTGVAFCPKCGQAQTGGEVTTTSQSAQPGMAENVSGLLCYVLGWVTGINFSLIDKRPYVRFHPAQSIVVSGGLHVINIVVAIIFGAGFMML